MKAGASPLISSQLIIIRFLGFCIRLRRRRFYLKTEIHLFILFLLLRHYLFVYLRFFIFRIKWIWNVRIPLRRQIFYRKSGIPPALYLRYTLLGLFFKFCDFRRIGSRFILPVHAVFLHQFSVCIVEIQCCVWKFRCIAFFSRMGSDKLVYCFVRSGIVICCPER